MSDCLVLEVLRLGQALLQGVAVVLWEGGTAPVSSVDVNGRVIVAVDHAVVVAVLLETGHVALDSAGGAQWLIDAVLERSGAIGGLSVLHGLLGVGPVRAGDAEQAAHFSVAGQSAVAVAHGLADAAEANVGDRGGVAHHGLIVLD